VQCLAGKKSKKDRDDMDMEPVKQHLGGYLWFLKKKTVICAATA
jgi:hypothetical protein